MSLDLVVIGLGPTGLAALYEASSLGMRAIGVDADRAVGSITRYLDGLPLVSPSYRFEIGGLPLDCRDPRHPTKEELIHYYARVVRAGGLDVRTSARWVGLDTDGAVRVRVRTSDGFETHVARRAVVTTWYRRAGLPAGARGVRVLGGLRSIGEVMGDRVVVIGGGLSAAEHAGALMLHGHAVTILARGGPRPVMSRPSFLSLVEASGSRLEHHVESARVVAGGVSFRLEGGDREELVPSDVALFGIGAELDPDTLERLVDAGCLDRELVDRLSRARSFETVMREQPWLSELEAEEKAEDERPDLWRYVFEGVEGVRFAGGVLHTGASNSGLFASIRSAELAVRAMAGFAPPDGFSPPLARALARFVAETGPRAPDFSVWGRLRPRTIATWSRGHISVDPKDEGTDRARAALRFLTLARRPSAFELDLLEACDGRTSVAELASASGIESTEEKAKLLEVLANLFRANVLTWLPG